MEVVCFLNVFCPGVAACRGIGARNDRLLVRSVAQPRARRGALEAPWPKEEDGKSDLVDGRLDALRSDGGSGERVCLEERKSSHQERVGDLLKTERPSSPEEMEKLVLALIEDSKDDEIVEVVQDWMSDENSAALSSRVYHELLMALIRLEQIGSMFMEWKSLSREGLLLADSHSGVLKALLKDRRIPQCMVVVETMTERGLAPTREVMESLVRCCVRNSDSRHAYACMDVSMKHDFVFQKTTYQHAITLLLKRNEVDKAIELALALSSTGIGLGQSLCSALLKYAAQRRRFDLIWELLVEAERSDFIKLDKFSCNQTLEKVAKCLSSSETLKFKARFEAVHAKSGIFLIDEKTYEVLIDVLAKAGELKQAEEIYREVLARGIKPTRDMFQSIIKACGKYRALDNAFELHEQMVLSGINPNAATFNALMNGCRLAGDVSRILQVIDMMWSSGIAPDVVSYSSLVDAYGRIGRVEDAFATVDDMIAHGVEPNIVTFTHLINAAVRAGHIDAAYKVLELMKEKDMQPNVFTYSALINGLAKRGEYDRAMDLMEQMRSRGIHPTAVTYATLLKSATRLYDEDKTRSIVRMLEDDLEGLDRKSLKLLYDLSRTAKVSFSEKTVERIRELLNH